MEYIMTIKPGERPEILPITRDELTLERMQELVGGNIETVRQARAFEYSESPLPPMTMLVNEEGLIRYLPVNIAAALLAANGVIFGTAIMVAVDDEDFRPFTADEMRELAKATRRILGITYIKGEDGGEINES